MASSDFFLFKDKHNFNISSVVLLVNFINFYINKRNWVFVTNSDDFLIPVSLQPDVEDHRYFKQCILLDQIILLWNIIGQHHQVAKIKELKIWVCVKIYIYI